MESLLRCAPSEKFGVSYPCTRLSQMVFAELVVSLQKQGKTASSHLNELYEK